eukprot:PhM_4_TR13096/c0_g2_i1/m.5692
MFSRVHDKTIREGDYVKADYDGIPTSSAVKGLPRPSTVSGITEDDRHILKDIMDFILVSEPRHYQLRSRDTEATTLYGIVKSVNDKNGRALVSAWKLLGEIIPSPRRPNITLHISRLSKISKSDFYTRCHKPVMARLDQRTWLKAAGFDESAPLSLIAYNNRIVSSLMERVDTTVRKDKTKSAKQRGMSVARAGGHHPIPPGRLRALPMPEVNYALEDPLAEVRAELDSLNAGSKTKTS